ncbi:hypothetical protein CCACVL1_18250 [Corchorus capsularis]|uniref:Endonuclease/exonuclease/phosphatase n=1 Tax=Corchorus capsularis TaxID=210143 RepID=A0A1R3HM51_COCAP|nr:hypothetical protein CCACVL1_18250 [Corchorus capsularis]
MVLIHRLKNQPKRERGDGWLMVEQIPPPHLIERESSMGVLVWNCRGAKHPDFIRTAKDLILIHKPNLMIITETRARATEVPHIVNQLPFDRWYDTATVRHKGGIWKLWNTSAVIINLLYSTELEIHSTINHKKHPSSMGFIQVSFNVVGQK